MNKILSKQVENIVDLDSQQDITGRKTFQSNTTFSRGSKSHHMIASEGFIYWVSNVSILDEDGNYRMGIIDNNLVSQQYFEGIWTTI
jgi:hypothetical protein